MSPSLLKRSLTIGRCAQLGDQSKVGKWPGVRLEQKLNLSTYLGDNLQWPQEVHEERKILHTV